jgi:hypothetical protein
VIRRLTLLLALLALAAPVAAYASTTVTRTGDNTYSVQANGCQVTKNADHSVTVHCSGSHYAALHWSFLGTSKPSVTVSAAHSLKYPLTLTRDQGRVANKSAYTVTQLVHDNTIYSVSATFGP